MNVIRLLISQSTQIDLLKTSRFFLDHQFYRRHINVSLLPLLGASVFSFIYLFFKLTLHLRDVLFTLLRSERFSLCVCARGLIRWMESGSGKWRSLQLARWAVWRTPRTGLNAKPAGPSYLVCSITQSFPKLTAGIQQGEPQNPTASRSLRATRKINWF